MTNEYEVKHVTNLIGNAPMWFVEETMKTKNGTIRARKIAEYTGMDVYVPTSAPDNTTMEDLALVDKNWRVAVSTLITEVYKSTGNLDGSCLLMGPSADMVMVVKRSLLTVSGE